MGKDDYTTVRIPDGLAKLIDDFLKEHPEFTSRNDFLKGVARQYIDKRSRKEE